MTSFSKVLLSGSTNGRGINITSNTPPGNIVHSTGALSSIIDEVWIYASNSDSVDHNLTIEFGGTISPNDIIKLSVPSQKGLTLITPGLSLTGTGAASCNVTVYSDVGNTVTIFGHVDRIS